ncbi:MAG TPA: NAD(P)/FAD-dependent oxidoreductase [Candidatus Krumholzibacteria bacterium]|nr:NAD(P)/FAD-dependent oxidoreductase [Candidatus Krumholzibacteria bacterium]
MLSYMREEAGNVVVGAGAAGLMTAIQAARAGARDILVLDGARKLGAKILIAGGGRCNVTHDVVDEKDFAGSSRHAIRKVLQRFDVNATAAFFRGIGVDLKREETGKLFPTTDSARTVLNALLVEARAQGVEIAFPRRVRAIERAEEGFVVSGEWGAVRAARVVIATGGRSIPKSGSDGFGYELVRGLGHTITPVVTPGLVPLTLPRGHFLCGLAGVTIDAALELRSGTGKRLVAFTDSTLLTHFGMSGPSVLDLSRYYLLEIVADPRAAVFANFLPGVEAPDFDRVLQSLAARTVSGLLRERLPERLARSLCDHAGVDPATRGDRLRRDERRALVAAVCELKLPVTGSRGYGFAEVTAGGVPLSEIHLETMESRVCPGLYLCGEICDVDGRIGGYNFQWAWSSGFVAGAALASGA